MPIYIIRHGETALNASRVFQPPDTPLNQQGLQQARDLGVRFRDIALDCIVTSDMARAMQTAEPLVHDRPGVKRVITPLLQERNLGDFRGQPYSVLGMDLLSYTAAPPGGESMVQFHARVKQSFEFLLVLAKEYQNLAVITHGLVIRELLASHVQLQGESVVPAHLANTSVSVFTLPAPYPVSLLNCSEHLTDTADPVARPGFGG